MGYSTDFEGVLKTDKPLTLEEAKFINMFSGTRRMKRNPKIASKLPDSIREVVGLPIGKEGGYFVGGRGSFGQSDDASVIDHNAPPKGQPGLWCQWIVDPAGTDPENPEDLSTIGWDGGEKFYNYIEWIEYLIKHFLAPWGYKVNGTIDWSGEECTDHGTIYVEDNVVRTSDDQPEDTTYADTLMTQFGLAQGWDDASKLGICLSFINSQPLEHAFKEHLLQVVEDESETEDDAEELCEKCDTPKKWFMHMCPNNPTAVETYGCPKCDDICGLCHEDS